VNSTVLTMFRGFWSASSTGQWTIDQKMRLTKGLKMLSAVTILFTAAKPRNLQYYIDRDESLKSQSGVCVAAVFCLMESFLHVRVYYNYVLSQAGYSNNMPEYSCLWFFFSLLSRQLYRKLSVTDVFCGLKMIRNCIFISVT
jgi:hypothetical protein